MSIGISEDSAATGVPSVEEGLGNASEVVKQRKPKKKRFKKVKGEEKEEDQTEGISLECTVEGGSQVCSGYMIVDLTANIVGLASKRCFSDLFVTQAPLQTKVKLGMNVVPQLREAESFPEVDNVTLSSNI